MVATNSGTLQSPLLTTITGATISLDGTGTIATSQWTNLGSDSLNVSGGTYNLANVTTIDAGNVTVSGGASLSLPAITSYANPNSFDNTQSQATGTGSTLTLAGITSLGGTLNSGWNVEALAGGNVQLANVTGVTSRFVGFTASGTGSDINLSSLTSFASNNSPLTVTNSGTVQLLLLTAITGVTIVLTALAPSPPANGLILPATA